MALAAFVIGSAAFVLAVVADSRSFKSDPTANTAPSDPQLPTFAGLIGHNSLNLDSLNAALDSASAGDLLIRLDVHADASAVDATSNGDTPIGFEASEVYIVDEPCDKIPDDGSVDRAVIGDCHLLVLMTVDELGEEMPGWGFNSGAYRLKGTFAIEGEAERQGTRTVLLRRVRAEDVP